MKRTINGGLFFPHSRIQVSFPARTGCRPELCCGSGLLRWLGAISSCNQLFRDKPKAHSACHKALIFRDAPSFAVLWGECARKTLASTSISFP